MLVFVYAGLQQKGPRPQTQKRNDLLEVTSMSSGRKQEKVARNVVGKRVKAMVVAVQLEVVALSNEDQKVQAAVQRNVEN